MFTLSAFPVILFSLAAVGLYITRVYSSRLSRLSHLLSTMSNSDRAAAIASELGTFGINASGLTPELRFSLATKEIEHRQARIRTLMQPLVSLIILAASLYVILSGSFSPQDKHWAFGAVGTVIGFWLKG